jgi:inorganic pyrophosphatase
VNFLDDLPLRDGDGATRVLIETPAGSAVKLKYEPALGTFTWSRGLPSGIVFPADFGFVPQTLAGDNEALDALVIGASAGFPGVVVATRLLGVLRVYQRRDGGPEKENHRVLAAPVREHRLAHLAEPGDLGARWHKEIAAFFQAYLALTGKQIRVDGWGGPSEAAALVDRCHQDWAGAFGDGDGDGDGDGNGTARVG